MKVAIEFDINFQFDVQCLDLDLYLFGAISILSVKLFSKQFTIIFLLYFKC